MIKNQVKTLLLILIALVSPQAFPASFNCARAALKIEKAICGSRKLSELDSQLAESYADAQKKMLGQSRVQIAAEQKEWLRIDRNSCTHGPKKMTDCLSKAYQQRLTVLKSARGTWIPEKALAFMPYSKSAESITGGMALTTSESPTLNFQFGGRATLIKVKEKNGSIVFKIIEATAEPGRLENNSPLIGVQYVVVKSERLEGTELKVLRMFEGDQVPNLDEETDSSGNLIAEYSYTLIK